MRYSSFEQAGIRLPRKRNGTAKALCPKCSHLRKKKDEPCVYINFDKKDEQTGQVCHLFKCYNNCGFVGAVFPDGAPEVEEIVLDDEPKDYPKPKFNMSKFNLSTDVVKWFAARGIHKETLISAGIKSCDYAFDGKNQEAAIMFPFTKNGQLINVQFRNLGDSLHKRYKSVGGCQLIYFGFDNVIFTGQLISDTLYVSEGLIDALTLIQCGYPFTWSVPNGTPFEEEGKKEISSPQLRYHDDKDAQEIFRRVAKVVFVGDDDFQGRKLVKELATRVGIEKCWRVRYPEGCKDINDVLMKYSSEKVIEVIEKAERFPVEDVVRISQLIDEITTLYHTGLDSGLSTGFPNLDEIFRVGLGKVIVLTGVPMAGKSRFLANIFVNMADLHGTKFSLFAPENRPFGGYSAKMVQIKTGKPFGKPGDEDRVSEEELRRTMAWMDKHFSYNAPKDRTLEAIKSVWQRQLSSDGVRYGLIDPFNYVDRQSNIDEHQYIRKFLTDLSDWCAINNFTAFVVAHPFKVQKILRGDRAGEFPVINPYMISGSANWFNCSDFIISIWRSIVDNNLPVELHIMKAKQEELGVSNKTAYFMYDVKLGIYTPYDYHNREEEVPFNNGDSASPKFRQTAARWRG